MTSFRDQLAIIKRRHHEASIDWGLDVRDGAETIVARPIPGEMLWPVARMDPQASYADRDFLTHAHADQAALIAELERHYAWFDQKKAERAREQQKQERERQAKDMAANCAMLCNDNRFRRYLHEVHGLENFSDSLRVETKVRSILGITSRRELNEDTAAAERWKALRADFEGWKR